MSQEIQSYLQYLEVLHCIVIPEHDKLIEGAFSWSPQNITTGHFGQQGTI